MCDCEWCNLTDDDKKWMLLNNKFWSVYLADEQDYIGRCILVLNRHCQSLSDLHEDEWNELKSIVDRLEICMKNVLGADLFNWSCLLNNFYKSDNPNPHLHIHVRPRYKNPVVINGILFIDNEFGHHYKLKKESVIDSKSFQILYHLIKNSL